jgi:hypothetical protein
MVTNNDKCGQMMTDLGQMVTNDDRYGQAKRAKMPGVIEKMQKNASVAYLLKKFFAWGSICGFSSVGDS